MYPFLITTDSGCDLSGDYLRELGVLCLPMEYEMDGQRCYETMNPADLQAFYHKMANGTVVHTSAVNIADYLRFFEPLLARKLPIVHIALGTGVSGSYQNAMLAREELLAAHPDMDLTVIDSLGASMVYGMQVIKAAELREGGMDARQCVEYLLEYRHHVTAFFTTGNLEYLYRGGRVSRGGMLIARTLNIWPILNVSSKGELKVVDKARGRKKAYQKIIDHIAARVENPQEQTLYICHSNVIDEAREFAEEIRQQLGFKDIFYTYIGATIGAHTGPGLVSAFFCGNNRAEFE